MWDHELFHGHSYLLMVVLQRLSNRSPLVAISSVILRSKIERRQRCDNDAHERCVDTAVSGRCLRGGAKNVSTLIIELSLPVLNSHPQATAQRAIDQRGAPKTLGAMYSPNAPAQTAMTNVFIILNSFSATIASAPKVTTESAVTCTR